MSPIEFYDTRRGRRVPFEPLEPGKVGIYSCGPTVYAEQHIGNLRSRLFSDLLKRFLARFLAHHGLKDDQASRG